MESSSSQTLPEKGEDPGTIWTEPTWTEPWTEELAIETVLGGVAREHRECPQRACPIWQPVSSICGQYQRYMGTIPDAGKYGRDL